ncbi:nuclease-related domain-containing protein [Paraliobacillus sp. JSM ZJ581]|uniref:nuclease-related domain-containing protein n=1 Tax=Paraliobacillus sp. JSM ZJ581 TaxID=3342118 RepID=UPI0035A93696
MSLSPPVEQSVPLELKILTYLEPRMNLNASQQLTLHNLNKGLSGERKLIRLLQEQLSPNYFILHDFLFKINGVEFQIDTLLIGGDKIYLIEVKNYEGDFFIKQSNWYSISSGNEIRNPIHQLKRSELLLQRMLQQSPYTFPIESYVVFINSEFQLYHATTELPIVFHAQINRFIKKLNSNSFNQTNQHKKLAAFLNDQKHFWSDNKIFSFYNYEQLKKGIVCTSCFNFLTPINHNILVCSHCKSVEDLESALMRSVLEFSTLFPDKKITTPFIYDWCQMNVSKKTIRRILKKQMKVNGERKHTYYTFN